jgi:hypothetical protein
MSYLRKDGNYKIYIIKHLWKDDLDYAWSCSGDCCQWIPKEILRKFHDELVYGEGIFASFGANGSCWQRTGIFGSYIKKDAIKILDRISEWNPDHRFKVCKLVIEQTTNDVVEKKYEVICTKHV